MTRVILILAGGLALWVMFAPELGDCPRGSVSISGVAMCR